MGVISAIKINYRDGEIKHVNELKQAGELDEADRIEYEYAYSPDLLPETAASSDGMWRYLKLLPVQNEIRYPLAVGGTPLVLPSRLRKQVGLPALWLKDETRSPTGSNKDRATALVLEHALHTGVQTVSCASTGNVALSLAVGAAACGLEAVIFVPASVSDIKLQLMRAANATIFKVREGYEAAVRLSRAAARAFGWYDRNTGYNPLTLEAKKTVAFEIWEQLGRRVPAAVVIPVGDGVTLNSIAKGFRELMLCRATTRLPRLIGVQAEHCQPLKRAWEGSDKQAGETGSTLADGIAVTSPINSTMAVRDVRESAGSFVAVSDEDMLDAVSTLAAHAGMLAEPAGAAALAGARQALDRGLLNEQEEVIVLVTGSGFKTPQYLRAQVDQRVYEVSADLNELRRIREQIL